jgi:hypothetical protein
MAKCHRGLPRRHYQAIGQLSAHRLDPGRVHQISGAYTPLRSNIVEQIEPNLGWVGRAGLTGRVSFARFSAAGIISAGAVDDGAADDLRPPALLSGKTTAVGAAHHRPLAPAPAGRPQPLRAVSRCHCRP